MHEDFTQRGYPLPNPDNYLDEDVGRIIDALQKIDEDIGDTEQGLSATTTALTATTEAMTALNELTVRFLEEFSADVMALIQNSRIPIFDFANETGSTEKQIDTDAPLAIVRGLGLFTFDETATDPVDGEMCLSPSQGEGRWLLLLPDLDVLLAVARRKSQDIAAALKPINGSITELTSKINSRIKKITASATLTWGALSAYGGTQALNITVSGAEIGDAVFIAPPQTLLGGVSYSGSVVSTSTVAVRLVNGTNAAVTPVAAIWTAIILKEGA